MDKKGISPLIATVLLIGFTIVLAAVVIRWGGDFITGTTESTTCEADIASACATQVDFEVVSADALGITVTIKNNADYDLDSFTVVTNRNGETVATDIVETPIPAFTQEDLTLAGALAVDDEIEVIAHITVEEGVCDGTCGENKAEFTVV